MAKLSMIRDINGYPIYELPFPSLIYSATLAAGVEETITVPGNSTTNNFVIIIRYEPGAKVYFALNATAAIPVGGTFAATTSCLNYPGTKVVFNDVLHFITSNTTADVGVEFYEF